MDIARSARWVLALAVGCIAWHASPAWALDPDSPEVKNAIQRGMAFLDTVDGGDMGHKALIGLTYVKYGAPKDHPKIKDALEACRNAAKNAEAIRDNIYPTGVAILFLVALDPSEYRNDIEALVKSLHRRQKAQGAWGYPEGNHAATCDTSMTQYAILGMWEAEDQAGVETPPEIWDKAAQWLILTQSPEGGFGYQGNVSNNFDTRVKQDAVKHSMSVAAMGAFYIVRDRLGLTDLKKPALDDTPSALKPFETPEERRARMKTRLEEKYFTRTLSAGDSWISKNFTIDKPTGWHHYYLYALERYETLREFELHKKMERTPRWYDQGARFLVRSQAVNGSWESQGKAPADTCFAVLFLLRSMKKSLEKSSLLKMTAGVMVGGRGLPEAPELRVREGKVVVKPLSGSPAELGEVLTNPDSPNFDEAVEALRDLASKGDPGKIKPLAGTLNKLARSGPRTARLAAIRTIGRSRDLDQTPLLIHLLNDRDLEIMREARDALRLLSRKFDGIGPGLKPTDEERAEAIQAWKGWFLSIRPDADLETIDLSNSLSAAQ